MSCRSGACKTGADKESYECVKGNLTGQITYQDEVYANGLALYGVCNKLLKAADIKTISSQGTANDGIKNIGEVTLNGEKGKAGQQSFLIRFEQKDLGVVTDYCKDKDGVAGFVLGLTYHDTTLLIGGNNDVAILGKQDCGGNKFSVYMDGLTASPYEDDAAIMCGFAVQGKPLGNTARYWSMDDLQSAVGKGGLDPKPLSCNVQLNKMNAPPDPGSANKTTSVKLPVGTSEVTCGIP